MKLLFCLSLYLLSIQGYTINQSNVKDFDDLNQYLNFLQYKGIDINQVLNHGTLKNSDYQQFKQLQTLINQQHTAPGLGLLSQLPVVGSITKPLGFVLSGFPVVGPLLEYLL